MEHHTVELSEGVHFVHCHKEEGKPDCVVMHAAIVTKVHECCEGEKVPTVNLAVFEDECEKVCFHKNVKHCAEKTPGTYHFACEM